MKKEHLLYLEKNNLEILDSYIEVMVAVDRQKNNDFFFSRKFSLDKSKKKYRLKYDNWIQNNDNVIVITVCTWIQIRVNGIKEKPFFEEPQAFMEYICSYIVEKIESIKDVRFTNCQRIAPYEYLFSNEEKTNLLFIVKEGESYSVYVQKNMKPRRYL